MKKRVIFAILILAIIIFASSAIALTENEIDRVIINSADWRDVYSGMVYANLNNKASNFLVSTRHSTLLLNQLDKSQNNILVISSKKNPYVVNYKPLLESRGFNVEEQELNSANLELAKRLDNIVNFVVIDDAYGYNAISVAPYAAVKKSFVLFADKRNIGQIENFLSNKESQGKLDELLIFGNVDREVKNGLSKFTPITINKGDRFENNIEIVKRYQKINPKSQVILSNGEFIEASMISGNEPVLFIGSANVPTTIADYIKKSDIKAGVLIGNELIGTATTIRRQVGIPVFVKFAQSARAPSGSISPVEDLDRFPMPKYYFDLSVHSARYNSATNQLEITYKNNVDLGTYIKSTITLSYGQGKTQRVGDTEPIFLDKSSFLTVTYDVESMDGDIVANIFTVFGEGKKSLENVLQQSIQVQKIKVFDESKISIESVVYDKSKGQFIVSVKNNGNVDAYATAEIFDIIINDEEITVGSENTAYISAGKTAKIFVPVNLIEEDISNNQVIHAKVRYGEREDALVKTVVADFNFEYSKADITFYILLIVIIILLILLFKKRRKKERKQIVYESF